VIGGDVQFIIAGRDIASSINVNGDLLLLNAGKNISGNVKAVHLPTVQAGQDISGEISAGEIVSITAGRIFRRTPIQPVLFIMCTSAAVLRRRCCADRIDRILVA